VIDSSQHAADTAYHNSLVELGKRLLACAKEGDTEGVRQLMSRGAPFTTDWLGTSPLHLTALYGRVETCEVLLKAGCSRDARTKVDKTPLHIAAQEGHTDICQLLLEQGADVDAKDMLHMTPLHWAVERGCTATVEALLRHGANTFIESKFDKTSLEIASENGRPDIFEMLQHADQYRVLAIDSGENGMSQDSLGLGVSQQEVVQTETRNNLFSLKAEQNIQYIKSELEALSDQTTLQDMTLDPIQIALGESGVSDTGPGSLGDISGLEEAGGLSSSVGIPSTSSSHCHQDEALKLLASHGITMLGDHEPPITPQSLSLTEAGKLALFSTSTRPNLVSRSTSLPAVSKPVTKVVTLNSKPVAPPAPSTPTASLSKAPRVIKLTPAQFAAIKRGRAGQIVLPALSSHGKTQTITLRNPSSVSSASDISHRSFSPSIAVSSPVPKKVIRLDQLQLPGNGKLELQKQLQKQLEEKTIEMDKFRLEMRKREQESERIKAQLKALAS